MYSFDPSSLSSPQPSKKENAECKWLEWVIFFFSLSHRADDLILEYNMLAEGNEAVFLSDDPIKQHPIIDNLGTDGKQNCLVILQLFRCAFFINIPWLLSSCFLIYRILSLSRLSCQCIKSTIEVPLCLSPTLTVTKTSGAKWRGTNCHAYNTFRAKKTFFFPSPLA